MTALKLHLDHVSPLEQVYTNVSRGILEGLRDMTVLEVPRGNSEVLSKLPSWVPDCHDSRRFSEGLTSDSQGSRELLSREVDDGVEGSETSESDSMRSKSTSGRKKDSQQRESASTRISISRDGSLESNFATD